MSTFFLQQLINGLTLGSVYGLIAIGYTMVYGIIGMINFAHGEVYMISAYLSAIGLALLAFFGLHSFPLLILGTLVFTIVVTGVYGWTIERIAYKPLRNSTRLAPLISAIGMSLILQNYVQLSQGPRQQGVPTMLDGVLRFHLGEGFVQITYTKVFILIASFAGMLVLFSSVALIVPLVTAIVLREWTPASHYLLSIGLSLIVGSALRFLRIEPGRLNRQQALVVSGLAWVVLAFMGAMGVILAMWDDTRPGLVYSLVWIAFIVGAAFANRHFLLRRAARGVLGDGGTGEGPHQGPHLHE